MSRIIVFANQKGGVGKTTTAVNTGAFIADQGKKVLLVDFDPQGNLSSSVGADTKKPGIYDVITNKVNILEAVQETTVKNLFILSSTIELTGANIELINQKEREYFLKKVLLEVKEEYDFIFIDCPPSLGILTLNGLAAATEVIVPLQCEYFALEGLTLLLNTIKKIQVKINPTLVFTGIVFTMYDSRTRLANDVVEQVTRYFKEKVFKTVIPRNIRLSEAPSHGVPINQYNALCVGAKSYDNFAQEVISRG
ncbi:MAG: ParA family protein [Spirochaetales bacterium]|nr:ParA family protein [Spirochaetales bacterium]